MKTKTNHIEVSKYLAEQSKSKGTNKPIKKSFNFVSVGSKLNKVVFSSLDKSNTKTKIPKRIPFDDLNKNDFEIPRTPEKNIVIPRTPEKNKNVFDSMPPVTGKIIIKRSAEIEQDSPQKKRKNSPEQNFNRNIDEFKIDSNEMISFLDSPSIDYEKREKEFTNLPSQDQLELSSIPYDINLLDDLDFSNDYNNLDQNSKSILLNKSVSLLSSDDEELAPDQKLQSTPEKENNIINSGIGSNIESNITKKISRNDKNETLSQKSHFETTLTSGIVKDDSIENVCNEAFCLLEKLIKKDKNRDYDVQFKFLKERLKKVSKNSSIVSKSNNTDINHFENSNTFLLDNNYRIVNTNINANNTISNVNMSDSYANNNNIYNVNMSDSYANNNNTISNVNIPDRHVNNNNTISNVNIPDRHVNNNNTISTVNMPDSYTFNNFDYRDVDSIFNANDTSSSQNEPSYPDTLYSDVRPLDSVTEQTTRSLWSKSNFSWSSDMEFLRQEMGFHGFRGNQKKIMNATMSGEDVFVLMPTGGGKSLCYQIPSVLSSRRQYDGKPCGITFVISPLVSLIHDQVESLLARGINAWAFTAGLPASEVRHRYHQLYKNSDETILKHPLIYVTPEKVSSSKNFMEVMESLYRDKQIARIVIDEAHCVSQWGHDFRPSYAELGILKQKFPDVPLLALTATASNEVKLDIEKILHMKNPILFKQSFNRTNLDYYIKPKGKNMKKNCEEIMKRLRAAGYQNKCGIIYCLSKKECEETAKIMNKLLPKQRGRGTNLVLARPYHASLSNKERSEVHDSWLAGRCRVICATIAFGMGIDKRDVRFVIHYSLPKSIEGYYQESGRAGRDGQKSLCILYYSWTDKRRMQGLISDNNDHQQVKRGNNSLLEMVDYCENYSRCRRTTILEHFDEKFNPSECNNTCDNCMSNIHYEEEDWSELGIKVLQAVNELSHDATFKALSNLLKGSKEKATAKFNLERKSMFGYCKSMSTNTLGIFLRRMITGGFISERIKYVKGPRGLRLTLVYIYVDKSRDSKANRLIRGEAQTCNSFPTLVTISSRPFNVSYLFNIK